VPPVYLIQSDPVGDAQLPPLHTLPLTSFCIKTSISPTPVKSSVAVPVISGYEPFIALYIMPSCGSKLSYEAAAYQPGR